MKKLFFILIAASLGFTACEEESLLEDFPAPPADNVTTTLLPYYGEMPVSFDSIYTNSLGIQFHVDSVGLLISNIIFHPQNSDELVDTASNWVLLHNKKPTGRSGLIPAGGYYGKFEIEYGGDANFIDNSKEILEMDPNLLRRDGLGANFFTIKARIFDPTKPPTDSVFIPVQYTLGTYFLSDTAVSDVRYFSVDNAQDVPLFLLADIKPILHNLNMAAVKEVKSDFFDTQDWTIAEIMRDSLEIGVF